MPVYRLPDELLFPDPALAAPSGLLAVGGDLSPERLELAYRSGIFPWYDEDLPILWHAPDPRFVLDAREVHIGRSLRKRIRQAPYEIRLDSAFEEVMALCAEVARPDQAGTWITQEMHQGYVALHERGLAHSVEAWHEDVLVGGLYGVSLGAAFFGESMFALAPDASKIAFAALCRQLASWEMPLVDCQVHTEHLESPDRPGPWTLDIDPRAV